MLEENDESVAESRPGRRFSGLLAAVATAYAAVYAVYAVWLYQRVGHIGLDSHAYWVAGRSDDPWVWPPGYVDAFLYSPAFQQVVEVPAFLPWPVFGVLWSALELACFVWLTRPLPGRWRVPALLMCVPAVLYGNVVGMLAVVAVLGLKRPGLWAFAVFTKVTIGATAVIWFAARGEWRKLAELLAVCAVVLALSWIADPGAWSDWVRFLVDNQDEGGGSGAGRWLRFAGMAVLVWIAARRDWTWVLPVGLLGFSSHLSTHVKDLSQLFAVIRLRGQSARSARTRGATSSP